MQAQTKYFLVSLLLKESELNNFFEVSKIVMILSRVNAAVESGFSIISDIWSNDLMVRGLDSQPSGPRFKTSGGWVQCQFILSSFQGQSNEYQKLLGDIVVKSKLSPQSGSVALGELNPTHKSGP